MTIEIKDSVVNPKIPYNGEILGGLQPGKMVFIQGELSKNPKKLTVNLLNGESDKDDIAFHFSTRFDDNIIVRNAKFSDQWGPEEKEGGVPFVKGHTFEMLIMPTSNHYKVAINGFYYTLFKYRSPLDKVRRVHIAGDASVHLIRILRTKFRASEIDHENWIIAPPSIINPKEPFIAPIGIGKLVEGSTIFIEGFAHKNAKSIVVNLKSGYEKDDDIPFHYNLRFGDNTMVINSYDNKAWAKEERLTHFPFQKGQAFEILYLLEGENYRVLLNGKPVFLFRHRINPERVNVIAVEGDLDLYNVWVRPPIPRDLMVGHQSYLYDCVGYNTNFKAPEEAGIHCDQLATITPPVFSPSTPFSLYLPGGFVPNRLIVLYGDSTLLAKNWSLNIQTERVMEGKSLPDVGFHMNVRYGDKLVVRNSRSEGKWLAEESTTPYFPFEKNPFELVVFCGEKTYVIAVNGQMFWEFNHRFEQLEIIDTLVIEGDIKIKHVCVC